MSASTKEAGEKARHEVLKITPEVRFSVKPDFSIHPHEVFFLYPPAATVPFEMEGTLGGEDNVYM